MAIEIVTALTGLLCTVVSSTVTFWLTKRKYNTEVDAQQIQNIGESFGMYKKMMEETLASQRRVMEDTTTSQNKKIEELQKENDSLKQQVNQLQMQVFNLVKGLYTATVTPAAPLTPEPPASHTLNP